MRLEPYLFFNGNCEEAIAFYQAAVGAQLQMKMHMKESPDQSMVKPGMENLVMYASLKVGGSNVMLSDMCMGGTAKHDGFALSLAVDTEEEAEKYFNALAAGGKVFMPLTETFFSPKFGQLSDKFGVQWMVLVYHA